MELADVPKLISAFSTWSHADKIKFLAWHLHTSQSRAHFTSSDIRSCYEQLNLEPPSSISPFLSAMADRKPKEALKSSAGYRLEVRVRQRFDAQYGERAATIHVHKLLSELPSKISDLAEQSYLNEALTCFRHKAFRAAIVMCWNLTFDHLCRLVLQKHLVAFNLQLPKSFPKADISVITKRDDFSELKESQVLQVCKSATIISGSLHKVLKEKLDRRNIAAHPSGIIVREPTAEEFIKDLVENVVLKLA